MGKTIVTPTIIVQNALPRVFDAEYIGSVHKDNQDIIVHFEFHDFEIDSIGDVDETSQQNLTGIQWFRKNPLDSDFTLVYSFNDIESGLSEVFFEEEYRGNITSSLTSLTSTVSGNILFAGQQFRCEIVPYDTIDTGEKIVLSNIIITPSTN